MKHEIFVVTAAYGKDTVLSLGGQQALLPTIAQSGADGVEIRRELLTETDLERLPELARTIADSGLRCFYSAPEALFTPDGSLNQLLTPLLDEARQLGAERLKFSLGHFRIGTDLTPLAELLAGRAVPLTIENDQTSCGTLAPLTAFFQQVRDQYLPIAMTFDMGNWHWVGEDAAAAARSLAPFVAYIHIKAARHTGDGFCAVPPDENDEVWQRLLTLLPDNAPRGIEFPLQGSDLAAVTRRFVSMLR